MAASTTLSGGRGPAIGIDLGTTYCCVAVCENDQVTIIRNDLGETTTPSHVAFRDSDPDQLSQSSALSTVTIGYAAKHSADVNPANAIYDVKRMIGKKFDDPELQQDISLWPFTVMSVENSPLIQVNDNVYHPEQISAMLLKYMKKQAETYLGREIKDAVITVPAYFTDGQRQATRDAGIIAGLNVLTIINEPTAAAMAYSHQLHKIAQHLEPGHLNPMRKKNVLIFDLGGGTFDLALGTMEGGNFKINAVAGDHHLGGQDFDNALVKHCLKEFEKKHNVDLAKHSENSNNTEKFNIAKRLRRIKNECEAKKVNLSSTKVTPITVEVIYETMDLNVRVKRETFEAMNQHMFQKCIDLVDKILKDASMKKEEVDDIVLIGGSSKIPKIQEMIKNYFGKPPCQNIKHDEAVAYGAALKASQSITESSREWQVKVSDVIPRSIGVQIHAERGDRSDYSIIVKKYTKVPCTEKHRLFTVVKGQLMALITIYEGESPTAANNYILGEFVLENLPPNAPAMTPVDITMVINEEGILHATALCPTNQAQGDIVVLALKGRLKPEDLERFQLQEYTFRNN